MRAFVYQTLMLSSALSLVCRAMADDEGEPIGIIELEENLSDVDKPQEIPAGVYQGEIQDVQLPTSAKGNQYFAIKFVIPPDELPKDFQESYPDGAVLYWNRNIVPTGNDRRALYNLKKLLESLGLDSNTTSIDPNEWMGRTAKLRVRHGKYQGETRAEIGSIEAAEAAAPARERAAKPAAKRRGK